MKSHFHVSSLSNHWIQSVDLKCYHFFFRMIVSWMFQPCATDAAVPSVAIQMSRKDKIALPCHPLKANLILSEDQCLYPRRPHALPVLITMDLKLQHPLPFLKARHRQIKEGIEGTNIPHPSLIQILANWAACCDSILRPRGLLTATRSCQLSYSSLLWFYPEDDEFIPTYFKFFCKLEQKNCFWQKNLYM